MPDTRGTVRGDLLSCYTASIAEYMTAAGIDPDLVIGTQAYLAVRPADGGICEFIQFHTPLRGDTPGHSLHLRRRHTPDPAEARARIIAEIARSGRAIVVGDTFNVPWQVAYQKSHAPHWFVMDGFADEAPAGSSDRLPGRALRVHVTDRFEFINDAGEQRPFRGWVRADAIGSLAVASPDPNPVYALRDLRAFADTGGPPDGDAGIAPDGYQWYELAGAPSAAEPDTRLVLDRLAATQAACTRSPSSGEPGAGDAASPGPHPGDGWVAGPDAAAALADHIAANIGEPATYDNSDDVWVTARNRQLFAETLSALGQRRGLPPLAEVGTGSAAEAARAWAVIPQLMQYNLRSLSRGRTPRPLVAERLRAAAGAERVMFGQLGEAIKHLRAAGAACPGSQTRCVPTQFPPEEGKR
jgi:hypothetical protein